MAPIPALPRPFSPLSAPPHQAWLRGRYADVVGLAEANNWQAPFSGTGHTRRRRAEFGAEPSPLQLDPKGMADRAAAAGFPFAVLFQTASSYNIGTAQYLR